jgi:hypothetical protein
MLKSVQNIVSYATIFCIKTILWKRMLFRLITSLSLCFLIARMLMIQIEF